MKYLKTKFYLLVAALTPSIAKAQDIGLSYGKDQVILSDRDPRATLIGAINVSLSLLAIICVSLIVYGGYLWMTSAGNTDQVDKARKTIIYASIGMLVVLSAWAITTFVLDNLWTATNPNQAIFK